MRFREDVLANFLISGHVRYVSLGRQTLNSFILPHEFNIFALDAISLECLGSRAYFCLKVLNVKAPVLVFDMKIR